MAERISPVSGFEPIIDHIDSLNGNKPFDKRNLHNVYIPNIKPRTGEVRKIKLDEDLHNPVIDDESEQYVGKVLLQLSQVSGFEQTARYSTDDLDGKDLIVTLTTNAGEETVYVQVKASARYIDEFYEVLSYRIKKYGFSSVEEFLNFNRLIIINANNSNKEKKNIENIHSYFEKRVAEIIAFYQKFEQ